MQATLAASIAEHFSGLEDPRIDRTKQHKLLDILVIAICAVICGADNWVEVALFGEAREEWYQTFLELPNGIPSHDTFNRVFNRLDPEQVNCGPASADTDENGDVGARRQCCFLLEWL